MNLSTDIKTKPIIRTGKGSLYLGESLELLRSGRFKHRRNKIDLLFTSPPFPLNRKKKYGNFEGKEYIDWLSECGQELVKMISPTGSIVIEMGNAWEKGKPTMSTLPLESLLAFKKATGLELCQEFILYNPARLPGPVEWVNKKRIRVKDSYTRLWWLSATAYPKADNRKVLEQYSSKMKKLLKSGEYNSGKRPSEHSISSTAFLNNNGGSIPSNVLTISNTSSNDAYLRYCKANEIQPHPARMQTKAVEFFIKFLTDEGDLVFDPFAGSGTTCAIAEQNNRRWLGFEIDADYAHSSIGRFPNLKPA